MGDKVTVEIELDFSYLRKVVGYDDEGDPIEERMTIEDAVVEATARQLLAQGKGELRQMVKQYAERELEEGVRLAIGPLLDDALAAAVQRTNVFGEAKGEPRTLREVIVDEAQKALKEPRTRNGYGSTRETIVDELIRQHVEHHFASELKKVLEEAKKQVVAAVQEKGAAVLAETITKMAGVR